MSARGGLPGARRVVVIGGGVSGLAAATLLARDGHRVTLLEAREELGGRAGTWEQGGFRFDTGPSWYLMPEVFDHYFRLLGTSAAEQLELRHPEPAFRVRFEGEQEPLDVSRSAASNAEAFERREEGAGRALDRHLASARRTYDMALRRFLYTSFDSPASLAHPEVLRHAPTLARLLVEPLDSLVGRRFQDRRLRQVLGYPAVFLGTSPDRAPSMYHLMSALDLTGGVQYPLGGFARVIEAMTALARREGVDLRTGARAQQILVDTRTRRRPRVTGVRVGAEGGAEEIPADLVVAAADLHHVETALLPPSLRTYPERWWRRRTPGPGAVLVMLGVRGALPQLAHHSLFFTRDWAENFGAIAQGRVPDPASSYVCRPSATDPEVAPAGHENLFVLVPVPADAELGRGGIDGGGDPRIEAIADRAIAQVSAWAGIPDLASRVVVRRTVGPGDHAADLSAWRGSMLGPAHTLRQSAMFRARNASGKVDGLLYAGSSTIPGIGVPMCLISGELVAKRVRGDRSSSPLPAPLPRPATAGAAAARTGER